MVLDVLPALLAESLGELPVGRRRLARLSRQEAAEHHGQALVLLAPDRQPEHRGSVDGDRGLPVPYLDRDPASGSGGPDEGTGEEGKRPPACLHGSVRCEQERRGRRKPGDMLQGGHPAQQPCVACRHPSGEGELAGQQEGGGHNVYVGGLSYRGLHEHREARSR